MAPDTMEAKVLIPEPILKFENKFNNDYFDRSVWLIEDLVSHNRLDFCSRYLYLGTYEEVYDDIFEYFRTVKAPRAVLRFTNPITGNAIIAQRVCNDNNRIMACKVDINSKRILAYGQERMPNVNKNN